LATLKETKQSVNRLGKARAAKNNLAEDTKKFFS